VSIGGDSAVMPQRPKKGRGRPRAPSPLRSIVSLKGSQELEEWLDRLVRLSESGTRSNALRRALRAFAQEQGFEESLPDR
jgi:hypothetical protein